MCATQISACVTYQRLLHSKLSKLHPLGQLPGSLTQLLITQLTGYTDANDIGEDLQLAPSANSRPTWFQTAGQRDALYLPLTVPVSFYITCKRHQIREAFTREGNPLRPVAESGIGCARSRGGRLPTGNGKATQDRTRRRGKDSTAALAARERGPSPEPASHGQGSGSSANAYGGASEGLLGNASPWGRQPASMRCAAALPGKACGTCSFDPSLSLNQGDGWGWF